MYDHILKFSDEFAALVALEPLGFTRTTQAGIEWDTSRVLPGVALVTADAVWDYEADPYPVVTTPRAVLPGYFVVIALDTVSEELKEVSGSACRLIADAEAASDDEEFIVWMAPNADLGALATVLRVEPTLAGRKYDFTRLGG